jgi:hypothetical protein
VPEVFVENDSYYMIGIEPSTRPARSGFHPVRVTVNRPDLDVRARAGYYDSSDRPEDAVPPAGVQGTLDRAMLGLVPAADLPLSLTSAAFRVAGKRDAAVAVVGGLDRDAESTEADRIDVAVRAFDESQRTRNSKGLWTSTLRLTPGVAASGPIHYDTLTRLNLPPGRYEVRLSMQSASEDVAGGVTTFVTVPDFEKDPLSVSGVVLGRASGAALPTSHPMSDVLPFAPTTRRAFVAGEAIAALLRLYQGGKDAPRLVSVQTRIVNESDEQVFGASADLAGAAFAGPTRAAEFRQGLPLATLANGEYLLTIEATLDERTVQATPVRFRVRGGGADGR